VFHAPQVRRDSPAPATTAAPTSLSRLGIDSGGALTERTGDSRVALDTALSRLSCVYSLGIRGNDLPEGRRYAFAVRPRKSGLRAVHASASLLRTDAMKRESLIRAAYFDPRSFETGSVHAALQRLEPASRDAWRAQLVLSFDVERRDEADRSVDVGATVTRGPSVVHRFSRAVVARGANAASPKISAFTLSEPITIPVGTYAVTAVLSDPTAALPRAIRTEVALPAIPRDGLFLVGPVLGRRNPRFEPLIAPCLDAPADLVLLTQVCSLGHDDGIAPLVGRTLRSASGSVLGELLPVRVSLEPHGEVRCASLVDVVPASALRPGGDYLFEARFADGSPGAAAAVRFSIDPSEAGVVLARDDLAR
jgi:hypothetical protein